MRTCCLPTTTVAVALVAVHAVVHVSVDAPMIAVSVRLGMAIRALEDNVIRRVGVAGRADAIRVAVIHGEPGVIEGCTQPTGGCVADRTRGRETRRHVIGTVGRLVVGFVTAVTVSRNRRVVVVHVAACAGRRRVRPR